MPMNHQIFYQLQDIFNLLPDISRQGFVESMHVKTNDQMLVRILYFLIFILSHQTLSLFLRFNRLYM